MSLRYVVLGCLEEPSTGYDLKQSMDGSLSHVWEAESSQIYSTLRALEKEGLLASSVQKSPRGPDRRVYQRTEKGDEAFHEWLEADPELSRERLSVLSQIHFLARERDPGRTTALLQRVRQRFVERLEQYEALNATGGSDAEAERERLFGSLALDLGMRTLRARIEWCDEVIRQLTDLDGPESSRA